MSLRTLLHHSIPDPLEQRAAELDALVHAPGGGSRPASFSAFDPFLSVGKPIVLGSKRNVTRDAMSWWWGRAGAGEEERAGSGNATVLAEYFVSSVVVHQTTP